MTGEIDSNGAIFHIPINRDRPNAPLALKMKPLIGSLAPVFLEANGAVPIFDGILRPNAGLSDMEQLPSLAVVKLTVRIASVISQVVVFHIEQ